MLSECCSWTAWGAAALRSAGNTANPSRRFHAVILPLVTWAQKHSQLTDHLGAAPSARRPLLACGAVTLARALRRIQAATGLGPWCRGLLACWPLWAGHALGAISTATLNGRREISNGIHEQDWRMGRICGARGRACPARWCLPTRVGSIPASAFPYLREEWGVERLG